MTLSIISVYNDKKSLKENLLPSLKKQTLRFELILIDNRNNRRFNSAASALNWAAKKAQGKYLLFVHQDIILPDKNWLRKAEKILNKLPKLGIAGIAGINKKSLATGYIDDGGQPWGRPFKKPQRTQTLDECLIIIPRKVFKKLQFDEKNFDHWHCYAVDYSLAVTYRGFKAYAIPLFAKHMCRRMNLTDLLIHQEKVLKKHYPKYKYICTTCGFLTPSTIAFRKRIGSNIITDIYVSFVRNYWLAIIENPNDFMAIKLLKRAAKVIFKKLKLHYD
ncbi:glycosyltransferase family protein [Patescibacteria group bacterium]|nr:glycosyltransferase family protein [Patescibacteria group bacterium]